MQPTVGRIVHINTGNGEQPRAAIIAYVHNATCINVALFDSNGVASSMTSVVQGTAVGEWSWPTVKA